MTKGIRGWLHRDPSEPSCTSGMDGLPEMDYNRLPDSGAQSWQEANVPGAPRPGPHSWQVAVSARAKVMLDNVEHEGEASTWR
jgi:hypothetical protein